MNCSVWIQVGMCFIPMPAVSFFAVEPAVLTLEGFLYPLDHYVMDRGDTIGISNEIAADEAVLTLDQGRLLVVRSRDDGE